MSTRYMFLNTRDRTEGTNAAAEFNIGVWPRPNGPTQLTIESIQLPMHMYPFSAERANLSIIVEEDDGATVLSAQQNITADRTYTGPEIAQELETLLTSISPYGNTYTVTYDVPTNRITATANIEPFRLVLDTTNGSPLTEIGYDASDTTFRLTQNFPAPVDLSGTKYLDVVSYIASGNPYVSNQAYNVIARFDVEAVFGEGILSKPFLQASVPISNLDTVTLELRDDRGRRAQLFFNSHVSYTIKLHT